MMNINVNGKEYKVEFSFGAAECKEIVQKMFEYMSGSYLSIIATAATKNESEVARLALNTLGEATSKVPETCITAIYAGCIDNNPVAMDEAKELTRAYIAEKRKTDKKYNYTSLFEEIKECMKDDGFFDLSGITEMVESITSGLAEMNQTKPAVIPQDHQKKQTSTK